jgi:Pyruvate/2-oxoacid:ferredoxin oxidoreductase delta subunit
MNSPTHTLIYFTGTGNSLAIARLLAQRLLQSTIISVNDILQQPNPVIETDSCGFVFPVYCQDAPEIVKRMIRLTAFRENAYLFAVATCNGDVGYSHFTLKSLLKKKGQRLKAGFEVLMPGNSINPYTISTDEEIQQRVRESVSCVDTIADNAAKRKSLPFSGSASLRKRLKGLRNMLRLRVLLRIPRKFWKTDSCNSCGICARICPENNISMVSGSPVWGRHCQICSACINWCPQRAIQNGPDTINRKRYHHPEITIKDMERSVG